MVPCPFHFYTSMSQAWRTHGMANESTIRGRQQTLVPTLPALWPWADYLTAPSSTHFICKRKYLHKLYKSKGPCDPVLFSTQKEFTKSSICTAAAAKSLQSCPTLCDPIDGSLPGPAIPGILQARTLEWVAISSSNAWKWKVKVKSLSCVWLLATPWTAAYQAPPSMGFSRQEYWSGVALPSLYICQHKKIRRNDIDLY